MSTPVACMVALNTLCGPAKSKDKSPVARPPCASTLKLLKATCLFTTRSCDLTLVVWIDPKRKESASRSPSAPSEEAGPVSASKSTCFS